MAQMTSGKVLREARERKGYDLATVARRLRIRPDILRSIEQNDFNSMPPRGYTRNMVNAYARLLGLNPTEIVNMYLDEAYANQVKQARGNERGSGFNMERETRRSRTEAYTYEDWKRGYSNPNRPQQDMGTSTGAYSRRLYDDRTRYAHDGYGVTRERTERPGRSDRDFMSHHSGYDTTDVTYLTERPRRGGQSIRVGQTPMEYRASRIPRVFQSRTAIIIGVVAVLVIIVVVAFMIINSQHSQQTDDVSSLPVSGINDTTKSSDESEEAVVEEVAPTSAHVVCTVKAGDEVYLETHTDDGQVGAEMLEGPAERTVDVTGVWTITTYAPDSLTVTVDGEKAQLKASEEYGGMYAYTVDFPTMLDEWKKTHTSSTARRSAAVAQANADAEAESQASASASSASASSADTA